MSWTSAQEQHFVEMLFAMGELFNESVSTVRAEMFCRAVEDLPFEAIAGAAHAHIKTSAFFPKPAELRAFVEGNIDDRAEIAWQSVLREIRRVGYYGRPTWPDEATERAATGLFGGSWRALCEHLPAGGPELLGYRKQFVASYGATARQTLAGALPPSRTKGLLTALKEQLTAFGLPPGKKP